MLSVEREHPTINSSLQRPTSLQLLKVRRLLNTILRHGTSQRKAAMKYKPKTRSNDKAISVNAECTYICSLAKCCIVGNSCL